MRRTFDYDSYRDFITDVIREKGLTATAVAERLGLKSKSYLGLILRGKKRLQPGQLHELRELFGLSSAEFDYFFHLVMAEDADSKGALRYHKAQMDEIRRLSRASQKPLQPTKDILSRWFYPILLLHSTLEKRLTSAQLAKTLGISVSDLSAAYEDLERNELVRKGADGEWVAQHAKLKINKRTWNMMQRRFLKDQISNALKSFDASYENTGKFYSQTITFAHGSFDDVWEYIKEKMDRLADRSDAERPEELIQLNVQFYKVV
ncbi:MAG: TIGR02147 family protein [Bdellovibrionaceae bacterium]|nr:TIGR02147 family protein [Pseudobdellovibrionaceae bacterium]